MRKFLICGGFLFCVWLIIKGLPLVLYLFS